MVRNDACQAQAQLAAAVVSIAFAIAALVKLYSASSASAGGLGQGLNWASKAQTLGGGRNFLAVDIKTFVWYLLAGTAAALAGWAAARMHRH